MDRPLAYLQLVLGISALTFAILVLFRLFTQASFDPEPSGNYGYYFVSFTLNVIAFAFGVAYVGSGVTAVVLFKLAPYGSRYVSALLKTILFNSLAVPCLFVQLVLSLIGLFYYVTTSVMHCRDAQLKRTRLYFCVAGFGCNLLFCGAFGGLAVRLIRRAFQLCAGVVTADHEMQPLRPDPSSFQQQLQHPQHQHQYRQLQLQLPSPHFPALAVGAGGPSNGDILGIDVYD